MMSRDHKKDEMDASSDEEEEEQEDVSEPKQYPDDVPNAPEAAGSGVDHNAIFPGENVKVMAHVPMATHAGRGLTVQEVMIVLFRQHRILEARHPDRPPLTMQLKDNLTNEKVLTMHRNDLITEHAEILGHNNNYIIFVPDQAVGRVVHDDSRPPQLPDLGVRQRPGVGGASCSNCGPSPLQHLIKFPGNESPKLANIPELYTPGGQKLTVKQAIKKLFQAQGITSDPDCPPITMAFRKLTDDEQIKQMHRNEDLVTYLEDLKSKNTYITFVDV